MSKAETEKKENRVVKYFREARAEMRKVTWPTRQEALYLTGIVLAVTVAMSILLWILDILFTGVMSALIG
ncbi:MAG TPA: preprotein translocase subunit SecE [Anaerolineae bacterium]|nr:preprotein translocase subunit SecE [Anaerolineae bacterium]HNU04762.1 preprotein translocase subunit SecE [Anaerolineae bacterium]